MEYVVLDAVLFCFLFSVLSFIWSVIYLMKDLPFSKMREDANVVSLRVHTNIIDHYNSSIRIIDLVSHTNYVVCVLILYISCGTYSFKVDSERQIFLRNFSWQFYFHTQSFSQKSAERKQPKKCFSYVVLMSGLELEPWLYV